MAEQNKIASTNIVRRGLDYVQGKLIDLVIEAELAIPGATGEEKRAYVVKKLDDAVELPHIFDKVLDVDGMILRLTIDKICDYLNVLTGSYEENNFKAAAGHAPAIAQIVDAAPLDAVIDAAETAESIDARISALMKKYGIKPDPDPAAPEGSVTTAPVAPPKDVLLPETTEDQNWVKALRFVQNAEGGWSNSPYDNGGKTNFGITEGTLVTANALGVVNHRNIRDLTIAEAALIYKALYWSKYGWGEIQWFICYLGFDATVNHGIGGPARIFQEAVNEWDPKGEPLAVDGKWGPKTRGRIRSLFGLDAKTVSEAKQRAFGTIYLRARLEYYERIVQRDKERNGVNAKQHRNLNGWKNRLRNIAKNVSIPTPEGL